MDTAERIEAVLSLLDEMIADGLITLVWGRVIAYRGGAGPERG